MAHLKAILHQYILRSLGEGLGVCLLFAACTTTAHLPEGEQLYTGITEIAYGHKAAAKGRTRNDSTGVIKAVGDEVNAALAYAPNNAIFGSSKYRWGIPIGLWAYDTYADSERGFGRWMRNTIGTQHRTISMANPQLRVQVARQTLRNYGFFHGSVAYEVLTDPHDSLRAKIAYSVYPGPLSRLGTIEYQRFTGLTDSIVRRTMAKSELHTGDAFSAAALDAERTRLSDLFRNNGFYYYRPEYITFRADTFQHENIVHLQVRPRADIPAQAHHRFYMGRTTVTVLPYGARQLTDSIRRRDFFYRWSCEEGSTKPPVRLGAIIHNLHYERGAIYRQRLHALIQSRLSAMGIFSNIQMNYSPRDTSATCDTLDVSIFAILDKPWDSEFEAKVTNKSNGLLGPGVAWGMTKRNAFRGAETVNFKIHGSYEWQTGATVVDASQDKNLLNSYELGASLTLTYPRLQFFNLVRRLNRRADASTQYKVDATWMNRSSYFRMINFGVGMTYSYQRVRRIKHQLTPLRIDYTMLTHKSDRFDSIMNANQALYVSMRNQLVPSMAYNFTYTRRWRSGHQRTILLGAKQSGHITNGIYALAGRAIKERDKHLLGVPFAQFLKLTGEWRETFPVTPKSCLAGRAFVGAVWSYHNSTMAPYADLFSVGGANSIRAFAVRSIGPGSYHPANSSWSYVDQVGNLKLEANVEYRFPLIGGLAGALFVDAGNVWLMKADEARPGGDVVASRLAKDIALGTGFGFRYDLDFLVLRFDVGVGIHAPYDTGRSGYYNMRRFWDSLGFHIAVGYPF